MTRVFVAGFGLAVAVTVALAGCDDGPKVDPGSDGDMLTTPASPDLAGAPELVDMAVPVDPPDASLPGRVLVWSDEFDGPAGQLPDGNKWKFDVGGDGWGNQQLEYNTNRPSNASLDGQGHLAIVARKEPFGGRDYTSARLNTIGHFSRAYGRFEARMQLPTGQGMWPAFWLLGDDIGSVGWPQCGEIDIIELQGQAPTLVHGTVHGPGYSGGQGIGAIKEIKSGGLTTSFHTYAVEWKPGLVSFLIDGNPYFQVTPASLPPGKTWVYNHPFGIIFDLAVGGTFVGSPDGTTNFPQTLLVDYVRVYEPAP
jgi:beta-glucanase (GH16 family)